MAYAILKYRYFGYLLPNPFYLKSNRLGFSGLEDVTDYLDHALWLVGPICVFYVSVALVTARPAMKNALRQHQRWLLLACPIGALLFYYTTIVHEVGEDYRFSYPTFFAFVVFAAAMASFVARHAGASRARTVAAVVIVCASLTFNQGFSWLVPGSALPLNEYNAAELRLAKALERTALGPEATIVHDAAGVVSFVSRFNHIDRVGLTDNYLSGRTPISNEERQRYLFSQPVDVYIGYEPPATQGAMSDRDDPLFTTEYVTDVLLDLPDPGDEDEEEEEPDPVDARVMLRGQPELLHVRMRELRDRWLLVGEIDWPGREWGWRRFAYVRRDSRHGDVLVNALRPLVVTEPSAVRIK